MAYDGPHWALVAGPTEGSPTLVTGEIGLADIVACTCGETGPDVGQHVLDHLAAAG